jgi:hypothetical protein
LRHVCNFPSRVMNTIREGDPITALSLGSSNHLLLALSDAKY